MRVESLRSPFRRDPMREIRHLIATKDQILFLDNFAPTHITLIQGHVILIIEGRRFIPFEDVLHTGMTGQHDTAFLKGFAHTGNPQRRFILG